MQIEVRVLRKATQTSTLAGYTRTSAIRCPHKRKACCTPPFYYCPHFRYKNNNEVSGWLVACTAEGEK